MKCVPLFFVCVTMLFFPSALHLLQGVEAGTFVSLKCRQVRVTNFGSKCVVISNRTDKMQNIRARTNSQADERPCGNACQFSSFLYFLPQLVVLYTKQEDREVSFISLFLLCAEKSSACLKRRCPFQPTRQMFISAYEVKILFDKAFDVFFFFFVLCIFLVLFSKSPCLVCCRHQRQSYQLSPSPR